MIDFLPGEIWTNHIGELCVVTSFDTNRPYGTQVFVHCFFGHVKNLEQAIELLSELISKYDGIPSSIRYLEINETTGFPKWYGGFQCYKPSDMRMKLYPKESQIDQSA